MIGKSRIPLGTLGHDSACLGEAGQDRQEEVLRAEIAMQWNAGAEGHRLAADGEVAGALEDREDLRRSRMRVIDDGAAGIGRPAVAHDRTVALEAGDDVLDVLADRGIEGGAVTGH